MPHLQDQIKAATPRHRLAEFLLGGAAFLLLTGLLFFTGSMRSTETTGALWWEQTTEVAASERAGYLQGAILLWVFAGVLGGMGIWLIVTAPQRKLDKLKRYIPILKGVESMPIQQIAGITNNDPAAVYRDIQRMIDSGMVADLYLDYQGGRVVSKKFTPDSSTKTVVKCSSCGAQTDVIVGIARSCPYCGQGLTI